MPEQQLVDAYFSVRARRVGPGEFDFDFDVRDYTVLARGTLVTVQKSFRDRKELWRYVSAEEQPDVLRMWTLLCNLLCASQSGDGDCEQLLEAVIPVSDVYWEVDRGSSD